MKILNAVGARPNFMKVAPLHRVMVQAGIESKIVHTGQHYDEKMSDIFFRQLEMPRPDLYLGVGSGTHAEQTARVMEAFDRVLVDEAPDLLVVVGDVNSTLACSLTAVKRNIPVAHVEAGLRSGDRTMPEEINRLVTDSISDLLFVTEQSGMDNLHREGADPENVFLVGNVMIDSLVHFIEKARAVDAAGKVFATAAGRAVAGRRVRAGRYALITMHRRSNVDHGAGLRGIIRMIEAVAERLDVVFPMHPRTRHRFEEFGLTGRLEAVEGLILTEPLGYLEFLGLMDGAAVLITDSGGIQEETTYLRKPCLTLRDSTERPVTVTLGTNTLLPVDARKVSAAVDEILDGSYKKGAVPELWEGRAAERIVSIIQRVKVSAAA